MCSWFSHIDLCTCLCERVSVAFIIGRYVYVALKRSHDILTCCTRSACHDTAERVLSWWTRALRNNPTELVASAYHLACRNSSWSGNGCSCFESIHLQLTDELHRLGGLEVRIPDAYSIETRRQWSVRSARGIRTHTNPLVEWAEWSWVRHQGGIREAETIPGPTKVMGDATTEEENLAPIKWFGQEISVQMKKKWKMENGKMK